MQVTEGRLNGIRSPPASSTLLTFSHPDLRKDEDPTGLFWGQGVHDDAVRLFRAARSLADTAAKVRSDWRRRERVPILRLLATEWLVMAASASLVLKVDIPGANRCPLDRRDVALLQIITGLRGGAALDDGHLDYLSSRIRRIPAAAQVLATSDFAPMPLANTSGRGTR